MSTQTPSLRRSWRIGSAMDAEAYDEFVRDTTNFLAFIAEQAACPGAEVFARKVGHQIDEVEAVFAVE